MFVEMQNSVLPVANEPHKQITEESFNASLLLRAVHFASQTQSETRVAKSKMIKEIVLNVWFESADKENSVFIHVKTKG